MKTFTLNKSHRDSLEHLFDSGFYDDKFKLKFIEIIKHEFKNGLPIKKGLRFFAYLESLHYIGGLEIPSKDFYDFTKFCGFNGTMTELLKLGKKEEEELYNLLHDIYMLE